MSVKCLAPSKCLINATNYDDDDDDDPEVVDFLTNSPKSSAGPRASL